MWWQLSLIQSLHKDCELCLKAPVRLWGSFEFILSHWCWLIDADWSSHSRVVSQLTWQQQVHVNCEGETAGVAWSGPGLALQSARPLHGCQHLLSFLGGDAPLLLEHPLQSVAHAGWHLFGVAAQRDTQRLYCLLFNTASKKCMLHANITQKKRWIWFGFVK